MTKKYLALSVGLGFIGAHPAFADWTGDAEMGASITSGNTETTVINAKLDMDTAKSNWHHNIFGDIFYSEDDTIKISERYSLGYKPRCFMSDTDYVFGILRYDQDEFSFIDSRTTEVVGYGRQFLNNDIHYLDGEIGVGLRQTDYIDDPSTVGLDDNETIGFLGAKYVGHISKTARFSETLHIEVGQDNTFTEAITGLGTLITGDVSAKLTYTVRHNSDVEGVNGDKTDSITGVNVLFSF